MEIHVKPCKGMTEGEALQYALSVFTGQKVDYRSYQEGASNGSGLTYMDGTMAYLYRTAKAYVLKFDCKGEEGK